MHGSRDIEMYHDASCLLIHASLSLFLFGFQRVKLQLVRFLQSLRRSLVPFFRLLVQFQLFGFLYFL